MKRKHLKMTAILALAAAPLAALQINEIRIDDIPGSDFNEYFELTGTPDLALTDVWYIILGDHSGAGNFKGSGTVEFALNLSSYSIGSDGYLVIGNATATVFDIGLLDDFLSTDSFENSDNVTHMLVRGYTGPQVLTIADQEGDLAVDIDDNDDGVPNEVLPWTEIIDAVSVVHNPDEGEWPYAAVFGFTNVGPDPNGNRAPGHIFRYSDTNEWAIGPGDPNSPSALDTPRAPNPAAPQEPVITNFSPIFASADQSITITGSRLAGVTEVKIGDVVATILNRENGSLVVRVPAGATSGQITVSNSAGNFVSSQSLMVISAGASILIQEDFVEVGTLGSFSQFSVSGSRVWQYGEFGGKGSARMNGFGDDAASDDWLISSSVDLSDALSASLNIRTAGRFEGPALEIKVSTNYVSGAPSTATWVDLGNYNYGTDNDYRVIDSGELSLSAFLGSESVHVAIRYTSGTGSGTTRNWQVHNIFVWGDFPGTYVPGPNPWIDEPHLPEGWVFAGMGADGLGSEPGFWINDSYWPWVFSVEHGWLMMETNYLPHVYMFDTAGELGWLYTQPGVYPFIKVLEGLWVEYEIGSGSNGGSGRLFETVPATVQAGDASAPGF